jgi:iron complex transport system substrate-binding protein
VVWQRLKGVTRLVVALAAATSTLTSAWATEPPRRIVSLNLCTDQLLLDLVTPERIVGVSYLGTDRTLSADAARLEPFKKLKGTAEEVLALRPDLVIAGEYTTGATVDLLRRLGQTVLVVPMATDFDGMRATLRQIAAAVGEVERGEHVLQTFDDRLRAARSTVQSRPTAIAYQVGSFVSGPESLLDAALTAAGYRNLARDLARDGALGAGGRLPLEQLVTAPPDLLVLANSPNDFRTVLADNLRHPALQQLMQRRPSVHLPMPYWMCATPKIAEAVEILASMKATGFAQASKPVAARRAQ